MYDGASDLNGTTASGEMSSSSSASSASSASSSSSSSSSFSDATGETGSSCCRKRHASAPLPQGFAKTGLQPHHVSHESVTAVICTVSSDQTYRSTVCSALHYHNSVGQHYLGQLWGRKDIRPAKRYLQFCLRACYEAGGEFGYANFAETSKLTNGVSVAEYIKDKQDQFGLDAVKALKFKFM